MALPHTFASKTGQVQLELLDDNFNELQSQIDNIDLSSVSGNLDIGGSLTLGDWTVTESNGNLYFAHSGTSKMKLDSSGNLTVVGNVTAYGNVT